MPSQIRPNPPAVAPLVYRGLAVLLAAWPAATHAQSNPAISTVVAFSGSQPASGPVRGPDGALYGVTSVLNYVAGGLIYRLQPDGSDIETLYQMKLTDGYGAAAGLLRGSDDRLYGTTVYGSSQQDATTGTVFALDADGSDFQVLHRFQSYVALNGNSQPINADGAAPQAELVEGNDGFLYGVTAAGGANGTGVVFKLARDGTGFAVLHTFGALPSGEGSAVIPNEDGVSPLGTLLAGADDFLYGTTSSGGAHNSGTIFRVRFDGSGFEVLHAFPALVTSTTGPSTNTSGAAPDAGLTDGQDGRYYGVTKIGGALGYGTLYALDPVGKSVAVLHDFDASKGARPTGELLLAQDGRLFGTTFAGGTNSSGTATQFGTVFSIARDGTDFASLHSFQGSDGSGPGGRLVQLDAPTFVGTTQAGGSCGQGTVFQLSLTGSTVTGLTNCGVRRTNRGGGGIAPALLLLLAVAGIARRLRAG